MADDEIDLRVCAGRKSVENTELIHFFPLDDTAILFRRSDGVFLQIDYDNYYTARKELRICAATGRKLRTDPRTWQGFHQTYDENGKESLILCASLNKPTKKVAIISLKFTPNERITVVDEQETAIRDEKIAKIDLIVAGDTGLLYCVAYYYEDIGIQTNYYVTQLTSATNASLSYTNSVKCGKICAIFCAPFVLSRSIYFFTLRKPTKTVLSNGETGTVEMLALPSEENPAFPSKLTEYASTKAYKGGIYMYVANAIRRSGELWRLSSTFVSDTSSSWQRIHTLLKHCLLEKNVSLHILQNGLAYLHGDCSDESCQERAHLYQLDLSAPRQFTISETHLGEGGFSKVFSCEVAEKKMAAKAILYYTCWKSNERQIVQSAITEAVKLRSLCHPNIIVGHGYKVEPKKIFVFMELMKESVRSKLLRTGQKRLETEEAMNILRQALNGLVYMHTLAPKPFMHRDVNCNNILLDDRGTAKLADFGLVKSIYLTANTNQHNTINQHNTNQELATNGAAGSIYWQAPEVVEPGKAYGRKSDVWSIGCTLVEMLTGDPPYHTMGITSWIISVHKNELSYSPKKLLPDGSTFVHKILEQTFRFRTKQSEKDDEHSEIRPHSWELLKFIDSRKNTDEQRVRRTYYEAVEERNEALKAVIAAQNALALSESRLEEISTVYFSTVKDDIITEGHDNVTSSRQSVLKWSGDKSFLKAKESKTFNIVVCGKVNTGKSSLVNALRHVKRGDADWAQVGSFKTTMTMRPYTYSINKHLSATLWDSPGCTTADVPHTRYFRDLELFSFNLLIIMCESHLGETELFVANQAAKYKIPFAFVRSKCDTDLAEVVDEKLSKICKETFIQREKQAFTNNVDGPLSKSRHFMVSAFALQNDGYRNLHCEEKPFLEFINGMIERFYKTKYRKTPIYSPL